MRITEMDKELQAFLDTLNTALFMGVKDGTLEQGALEWFAHNPEDFQRHIAQHRVSKFKPSISINIGTGLRTADDFTTAIAEKNGEASKYAIDLMNGPDFIVSSEQEKINLVFLSRGDLGLGGCAPYWEICRTGVEEGLELCLPEDGPQLREQYTCQPEGECLFIAMEPISGLSYRKKKASFSVHHSPFHKTEFTRVLCSFYDVDDTPVLGIKSLIVFRIRT